MTGQEFDRRGFLKGAVAGGAAAASAAAIATPEIAQAEAPASAPANAAPEAAGYAFFNLDEAAFIEALVDHMIPADEVSPRAPISASTSISIARSRAAGAKAIGSICRGPGSRAHRAKATSCR